MDASQINLVGDAALVNPSSDDWSRKIEENLVALKNYVEVTPTEKVDRAIISNAIRKDPIKAFGFLSDSSFAADKEFFEEAVEEARSRGDDLSSILWNVAPECKANFSIGLLKKKFVKLSDLAMLKNAEGTELNAIYDVVLEAVKADGAAIEHADERLKRDPHIIFEAMKTYRGAAGCIGMSLQEDQAFCDAMDKLANDYGDDTIKQLLLGYGIGVPNPPAPEPQLVPKLENLATQDLVDRVLVKSEIIAPPRAPVDAESVDSPQSPPATTKGNEPSATPPTEPKSARAPKQAPVDVKPKNVAGSDASPQTLPKPPKGNERSTTQVEATEKPKPLHPRVHFEGKGASKEPKPVVRPKESDGNQNARWQIDNQALRRGNGEPVEERQKTWPETIWSCICFPFRSLWELITNFFGS